MSGGPSQNGFLEFLRQSASIPTNALPDDSPVIPVAYSVALALVNCQIRQVSCLLYTLAVYNLATSNVINYAPDPMDGPTLPVGEKDLPYFEALRTRWNLLGFVSGVIESSHDVTTGASLVVPAALSNLTIADLQNLKDPFGRAYLALAQRAGSLWGLS